MLFTTPLFLVFITVIFFSYWMLPFRLRWILLLAASLFFYGVHIPGHLGILLVSVLFNYYFGILIDCIKNEKKRKHTLIVGVLLNVAFLAIFKYADTLLSFSSPLISSQSHLFTNSERTSVWIIPLGVSFYTFTNISYLIEIKQKHLKAERHFGHFANFITFFPKLIQGPIERPQFFLPQLKGEHIIDYHQVTSGIKLMLWGFFKKLVIADRLALAVNSVFADPSSFSGPAIVIAAVFYSVQIYADFSGYIDIARGVGKVLGFELSRNFNTPYIAKSIKDFWSRWHITLSKWLRDYIFLPLAFSISRHLKKDRYLGIKTDKIIYSCAISVTFIICGIWHGIGWTFFIWGAIYAFYLVIGHLTEKPQKMLYKLATRWKNRWLYNVGQVFITFSLVTIAWIVFRASSMKILRELITGLFSEWGSSLHVAEIINNFLFPGFGKIDLAISIVCSFAMFVFEYLFYSKKISEKLSNLPIYVRWGAYYAILFLIFTIGKLDCNTFVYFQF